MNNLTDLTHRSSSSDLDSGFGRALVGLKSDARAGFGRLGSITFITASVAATVGWLWFLVDAAEWLIGVSRALAHEDNAAFAKFTSQLTDVLSFEQRERLKLWHALISFLCGLCSPVTPDTACRRPVGLGAAGVIGVRGVSCAKDSGLTWQIAEVLSAA